MMDSTTLDRARIFIQQPAPTYDTYQTWRSECILLGDEAVAAAFESLRAGSDDGLVQETAIYVLNEFGYEVYDNEKYESTDFSYFIKRSGTVVWDEIKPLIPKRDVDAEQYELVQEYFASQDETHPGVC